MLQCLLSTRIQRRSSRFQMRADRTCKTAQVPFGISWNKLGFNLANTGVTASRSLVESWTLTPITDPRKLQLMHCAYQQAISPCLGGGLSGECPDCNRLLKNFYTGNPDTGQIPSSNEASGAVTIKCVGTNCWFGTGCRKCIPKGCPCLKVGHYCGLYVWVLPGGQEELTKLTFAIMDFAIYEPAKTPAKPPQPTKEVTLYFDASNNPTTPDRATRIEKLIVPVSSAHLLQLHNNQRPSLTQADVSPPEPLPPVQSRTPIPNSEYLQFQQNLQTLAPQSNPFP